MATQKDPKITKTAKTQQSSALKSEVKTGKPEPKFAEGLCFKKLFFIFLIGSVIGSLYEEIINLVHVYHDTGQIVWSLRRGVIYGPFNVIYGFGAVIMILILARKTYTAWQVYIYSALLGGIIEYLIGFLQDFFTHTTSWDYSDKFLNINGRTTIPYMLVWGMLGLILVKVIYPAISHLIERVPMQVGNILFWTLLIFMIVDMLISWTAIIRQTLRHNNVPPFTPVGEFYDSYYTDDFLEHYFPNMSHHDKGS